MKKIIAYTDGGSRGNPGPAAAGICLYDTDNQLLHSEAFYLGNTTNNVAEYTGVLRAVQTAKKMHADAIDLICDSELLVKQLNGVYRVKSPNIKPIYQDLVTLLAEFKTWKATHVRRHLNEEADAMVNEALDAGTDILIKSGEPIPSTPTLRIGAMISGGGRTILNILDCISAGQLNAEIPIVIASRSTISGIKRLEEAGLAVKVIRKKDFAHVDQFSTAISDTFDRARVDLVIQGGWLCLWKIPEHLNNRVMNIHPALLPSFGGQGMWGHHVHEAVLKRGCKVSGCTVHFCTDDYDAGPIIAQRTCPVKEGDDADTLADRVFEQECLAFPEAISLFAQDRVSVKDGVATIASE